MQDDSTPKQRTCLQCGKPIPCGPPNRRRRFCSKACFGLSNVLPVEQRFWKRVAVGGPDDCWPWQGYRVGGYGRIEAIGEKLAHRVSWRMHFGDIPEGMDICHSCDNPPCVNPAHLFLGTHADNNLDKLRKGRQPTGMRIHTTKLNCDQVREIRQLLHAGTFTRREIAQRFGVTHTTINDIKRGKNWRHC